MRNKSLMLFASLLIAVCLSTAAVAAGGPGHKKEKKSVSFSWLSAPVKPVLRCLLKTLQKKTKAAYPDIPVRWAYTSTIIRKKLAKQGQLLDSPEVALAKMQDEGFTHVAVQSLHTIGGEEYHDLRRTVGAFKIMGAFQRIITRVPPAGDPERHGAGRRCYFGKHPT